MTFVPPPDQWVKDHFFGVPQRTAEIIGNFTGKTILDVGCGDMMSDMGLLHAGAGSVVGLDIAPLQHGLLEQVADRIKGAGYYPPADYNERLIHTPYNGRDFPFPDDNFEVVFSWGVFEHVQDVRRVLSEMKRVMRSDGVCFIKVFPWWHSFYGSHLSDWVPEPFAHLKRPTEWIKLELERYVEQNPNMRSLLMDHVWPEFTTLNRYSAEMFYQDVKAVGWTEQKWQLTSYPMDLTLAPSDLSLSDLLICGSECVLRKS